jgi:hypothetical protein
MMVLLGLGIGSEMLKKEIDRYKERSIRKVESESRMMKEVLYGKREVKGLLIGKEILEDGRTKYEMYVRGEGTKVIRVRDEEKEREKYKMYELKRYVEEKKGGMKLKMEFV